MVCITERNYFKCVGDYTESNKPIQAERPLFHYAFHFSFIDFKVQLKQELNVTMHFCEK